MSSCSSALVFRVFVRQQSAMSSSISSRVSARSATPPLHVQAANLSQPHNARPQTSRPPPTGAQDLFGAFPDLGPIPGGIAFGDDVLVAFGQLHGTMKGPWLGLEPTGREFTIPLVNIVPFKNGLMEGERLFYDTAMLCEQAGLDVTCTAGGRRQYLMP